MVLTSPFDLNKLYSFNDRRMHAKLTPSGNAIVLVSPSQFQPANPEWEAIFRNLLFADAFKSFYWAARSQCIAGNLLFSIPKQTGHNLFF